MVYRLEGEGLVGVEKLKGEEVGIRANRIA